MLQLCGKLDIWCKLLPKALNNRLQLDVSPANFWIFWISEKITASAAKVREVAKWGKVATGTKPKGVKDKTDSGEVSGLFPTPSGLPGFGLPKR